MITNFNLSLLNGGHYLCSPHWDAMVNRHENCYKLYFPIRGKATIVIDGKEVNLEAGKVYFISGMHLDSQRCPDSMDVYWVHFMPDSLKLRYKLSQCAPFFSWPMKKLLWAAPFFRQLHKIFECSTIPEEMTLKEASPDLMCRIHGVMTYLLGDLFEQSEIVAESTESTTFQRLDKAIEYMDNNYLYSPSLEDIACQSHLAPNYFHRLFKKTFDLTPYQYMLNRRMNLAQQLISSTDLTVKEIAFRTGYDNEFHFSRTFKKYFKLSPSQYRQEGNKA